MKITQDTLLASKLVEQSLINSMDRMTDIDMDKVEEKASQILHIRKQRGKIRKALVSKV